MVNKTIINVIIFVLLLNITLVSATSISIGNGDFQPTITRYTGIEKESYKPILKESEVCYEYIGKSLPSSISIYTNKEKSKTLNIEPTISELFKNEFCISYKDYLQLGENTIVIENQSQNQIIFNIGNENISANYYWDVYQDGSYWENVNDLFVSENNQIWKHGANHTGEWERYKIVYNSTASLIQNGNSWGYTSNNYDFYRIDNSDVCNKINSTNGTSECLTNIQGNSLSVEFYSDEFIDPSFQYQVLNTTSILSNVTFEGDNSTHLTINSDVAPYNNLVLYYPMDVNNSQSIVYDYSPYGNDGTKETIWNSSGVYGGSEYFHKENSERIIVSSSQSIDTVNQSFTISLWFNGADFPSSTQYILSRRGNPQGFDRIYFNTRGGNKLRFSIGDTQDVIIDSSIQTNTWYNVALAYNGSNYSTYLNGVNKNNGAEVIATDYNGNDFCIGCLNTFFNGSIDEVMIFNTSLNPSQILDIYNNQSARFVSSGTQVFNNTDLSSDSPDLANFTLIGYQTLLNSNFSVQVDDGAITPFVNGEVTGYDLSGVSDLAHANVSIIFNPDEYKFYSPILFNNVNISTYISGSPGDTTFPTLDFKLPTLPNNSITNSSVEINISIVEENLNKLVFNWNGTNTILFDNNLIAMYNFNNLSSLGENDTNVFDVSGNENNLTSFGEPKFNLTDGFGGAYNLDGIDDYFTFSDEKLNFTSFTISIWFKGLNVSQNYNNPSGDAVYLVWVQDDAPSLKISSAYHLIGTYNNGTDYVPLKGNKIINDNDWNMGLISYNNNTHNFSLYLNGKIDTSRQVEGDLTNSNNLRIGRDDVSRFFNGSIDDVMIFNKSLNSSEVQQLYFSNLYKYNKTNWYLYINQSLNSTTPLSNGTYTYFASATDDSGNTNTSQTRIVNIGGAPPTDNEYPLFSSFIESPTDSPTYLQGQIYEFNTTITSTNGTAGIEFDGVNYTLTNQSNVFNFSIIDLGVGVYNYYYWAYGNGTDNNFNQTEVFDYTITQATTQSLLNFSLESPISYPQQVNATCGLSPAIATPILELNGTAITSGELLTLGVGNWNVSCYYSGNNNYSSSVNNSIFTITQNSTYLLGISGTTPINYGDTTDVAGSLCPDELSCALDKANAVYGAGTETFNYSTTGNNNYSSNSITKDIVINKATPTLSFLLNGDTNNLTSLIYPYAVNLSAVNSSGTLNLEKDEVNYLSNNHLNRTFAVGSYIFRANITGNQNYSDVPYINYNATILQGTGVVYTYINNQKANRNLNNNTLINITSYLITGMGNINLSVDGIQREFGTSPLQNLSIYPAGTYYINTTYEGNINWTFDFEQWKLIIINATAPSNVTGSNLCLWRKFGYFNPNLPFIAEPNCF